MASENSQKIPVCSPTKKSPTPANHTNRIGSVKPRFPFFFQVVVSKSGVRMIYGLKLSSGTD